MRRQQITSRDGYQSVAEVANRRQSPRPSIEFGLMYSAQDHCGEVLMGDGMVTDLSPEGLGIRGNVSVKQGIDLTIFLYLLKVRQLHPGRLRPQFKALVVVAAGDGDRLLQGSHASGIVFHVQA